MNNFHLLTIKRIDSQYRSLLESSHSIVTIHQIHNNVKVSNYHEFWFILTLSLLSEKNGKDSTQKIEASSRRNPSQRNMRKFYLLDRAKIHHE
mmetsp:Transcript_613/g.1265  ORF Transcript_613/g.1265 Transcript_613/m.1265 type:complete len:93 (-) Transcript_613:67-345(-)